MALSENERWLLSYYRTSEINGSLFFGRLARVLRASAIQHDLTKHFADEAQHAWYWTRCLRELDVEPIKMGQAYQDQYLEAAGLPVNLMEILSITLVFERRVIGQYARHRLVPGLPRVVTDTFLRIMEDEKWHLRWVGEALKAMETEFGEATVRDTLQMYRRADQEVYARTLAEHGERLSFLHKERSTKSDDNTR